MNSHYFVKNPSTPSKEKIITYQIHGLSIPLLTDTNVFAKNGVDEGSDTLLKVLIPLIHTGKVLDIGCGYGVIGLTLASLIPDILVTASDINLRAVDLCQRNAHALELSKQVTSLQSDLYEKIEGKFDYVVSNPPIRAGNAVLIKLYRGAHDHLKTSGSLFIVVRKKQGAESTVTRLKEFFSTVEVLKKHKGYWVIKATK
ncbi:MAG: methyltransferase [Bacilli bacterium]|nr:methyltransferase [Bacilli bacterium]